MKQSESHGRKGCFVEHVARATTLDGGSEEGPSAVADFRPAIRLSPRESDDAAVEMREATLNAVVSKIR